MRVAGCCGFAFIFGLSFISGIAGLFPVFTYVLVDKLLIINTIHFSGLHCVSGGFMW